MSAPSFGTALHAGVVAARVTRLDKAGVALRGQALVYGSAQAMGGIARSGTDVACQSRERTADDTDGVALLKLSQPQSSHLISPISYISTTNSHPSMDNGNSKIERLEKLGMDKRTFASGPGKCPK